LKNHLPSGCPISICAPPYDTREVVVPLLKASDMVELNDVELERVAGWFGQKGDELTRILCSSAPLSLLESFFRITHVT